MSFLFCPDPLCSASRYRLDGLSDPPGGEANHGYTVAGGSTTTDEACVKRDAEVLSPRGTGERNGANDSNGAAGSAESRGAGTEWGSQSASGMFPSSGETEVERVCGLLTDLVDTPSQAMSRRECDRTHPRCCARSQRLDGLLEVIHFAGHHSLHTHPAALLHSTRPPNSVKGRSEDPWTGCAPPLLLQCASLPRRRLSASRGILFSDD